MYPTICRLGPLTVYSYGLMFAVAIIVCALLLSRDARKKGINPEVIFDLVFWVAFSGIVGARVFFVLMNLGLFWEYPQEIIMLQRGGLAFQGGLLAGILAAYFFMKKKGLSVLPTLDLLAPYIALGHAIGRIGCFLNGCCYGYPVSWGIYFPVHDAHLHPTQLYSSVALLALFFILKRMQLVLKIPGQVFAFYLMLYPVQRFAIEFFRADHLLTYLGLSIFQFVCIGIFLAGTIMNWRLNKNFKDRP